MSARTRQLFDRSRGVVGSGEAGSDADTDSANADDGGEFIRLVGWWLALLSPVVVPWVVVRTTSAMLVFPWGMVTVENWYVVSLLGYLDATRGLPRYLRMWPFGTLCYALALAWAAGERIGADQRVTAGLLALGAITAAWMASGLGVDPNRTAIPLGSILLFALAAWAYVRA